MIICSICFASNEPALNYTPEPNHRDAMANELNKRPPTCIQNKRLSKTYEIVVQNIYIDTFASEFICFTVAAGGFGYAPDTTHILLFAFVSAHGVHNYG